MKRYIVFAVALAFVALPMFAQTGTWNRDAAGSNIIRVDPGVTRVIVGPATSVPGPFGILVQTPGSNNSFLGVRAGGAAGAGNAGFIMERSASANNSALNFRTNGVDTFIMGVGVYAAGDTFTVGGNAAAALSLTQAGNLTVVGSITAGSVIGAVYQDVAEWVPATEDLAPGTVVALNPEAKNQVMASSHAYDTMVAGVVSAQPGLILGKGGAGQEQIATTGRVKVMVDATNAPIHVGDLLVTSDTPGVAMKSQPMEINGRQFHQPGTILGKALEPMSSGRGEILVLLSLQ